jgi:hypothetical protein
VSVIAATFMTLSASVVTWLCTSARWRRAHEELRARIARLQDDTERARTREAQVTHATAEWSDGYKQGCSDMIRAMAAMQGGGTAGQQHAEGATSAK